MRCPKCQANWKLSWDVVPERTTEALQTCLERAPQAGQYYSDAFLCMTPCTMGLPMKCGRTNRKTYSVEAVNADFRHYLKRLARRSRVFPEEYRL
jgi:IS1 family transposase